MRARSPGLKAGNGPEERDGGKKVSLAMVVIGGDIKVEIKQSSLALRKAPFSNSEKSEWAQNSRVRRGRGRRRFTVLSIIIDMTAGRGGAAKS